MDKIDFSKSEIYQEDIKSVFKFKCDWNKLKNKTILITGATGLIGTYLVDMFFALDKEYKLNVKLILIARHVPEIKLSNVKYVALDISKPFNIDEKIDFIIHAASNTHPVQYSTFPISTITTNVFGIYNLLELASKNTGCRVELVSSVEIYGNDVQNIENGFSENDFGFLDCNTVRAGYNESKRLSETLCQAYKAEKNTDVVIARLCRSYGPTLKKDDSKALSQFLRNGLNKQNIVLKSKGEQYFSYIYAAAAASALIYLLLKGESGQAYNVADKKSDIKLKDLAGLIADYSSTKVIFELPDEVEAKGFSKSQTAILNSTKINSLGWHPQYDIKEGIKRTLECLKNC